MTPMATGSPSRFPTRRARRLPAADRRSGRRAAGPFLLSRLAADGAPTWRGSSSSAPSCRGRSSRRSLRRRARSTRETLTGFKWIVRAADLREDVRFAFGYEEALGYAVTSAVRDKDGISAALAVLSLAAAGRSAGESLQDAYDALEVAHGVHLTAQITLPTEATVRSCPGCVPRRRELAGEPVTSVTDYSGGKRGASLADMLSFELPGARVVIRPSGTEPKIKAYLEVVELVVGRTLDAARSDAGKKMDRLRAAVRELPNPG